MKIVIINGSARKGNTLTAINTFIKGAAEHNEIEMISPDKLHIAPCKGCKACQCHKGCVDQDDTNPTIDKIAAADMILFADVYKRQLWRYLLIRKMAQFYMQSILMKHRSEMLCITIMEHIGIFERMSWIIRTQDITITNRVIQKAA